MSAAPHIAFSHIGIFVTDIDRMEKFYKGHFGFIATDRGELDTPAGTARFVFLSRDPREHHQLVLATGRPADLSFNIVNQMSFRTDSLKSLRDLHTAVAADPDASDIQPVTHGNAMSVYFRDPEGNRIELFIDTPWYVDQPLRVPMDLSLPDDQLWKWAEDFARSRPGFKPIAEWEADMSRRMGVS
ncbi:MAG: glyoxalase [Betaproteobacteria bacterium]|nr:glyoxalase [Betaproteobacteria bacterium]